MKIMQYLGVLLVLFIFSCIVFGGKDVKFNGNVFDDVTRQPIENVEIKVKSNKTLTNKDGFFEITITVPTDLHSYTELISFYKSGYQGKSINVKHNQKDIVAYLKPDNRYIFSGKVFDNTTDKGIYCKLRFEFEYSTLNANKKVLDMTNDTNGSFKLDFYDTEWYYNSLTLKISSNGYLDKELKIGWDKWIHEYVSEDNSVDVTEYTNIDNYLSVYKHSYDFGIIKMSLSNDLTGDVK